MRVVTDLTGKQFGRLTVLQRSGSKGGNAAWECLCECGNKVIVKRNNLTRGTSKSCGCLERELRVARMTTHGMATTPLYRTWAGIKRRCYNANLKVYKDYGAKGITMCDEWKDDFQAFYDWAMANGYNEGLTIDRINSAGNYEPGNCQWLTRSENSKKSWEDRRNKLCAEQEKS